MWDFRNDLFHTKVKLNNEEYHVYRTQDQQPICNILGKETAIELRRLPTQDRDILYSYNRTQCELEHDKTPIHNHVVLETFEELVLGLILACCLGVLWWIKPRILLKEYWYRGVPGYIH